MHSYIVAGLTVESEFDLPELAPCDNGLAKPDVEIRFGSVPQSLPGATDSALEAEIAPDEVLLKIPGIARYRVTGGRQILVEPDPEAQARDMRLFLLGSAFGALWFQRGYFPLHASVVVVNGQAVAFAGDSGAGKSTMAAWMHAQGYPLLCDDVCVIRFDEEAGAMAFPGFPRLKLWKDALHALDIASEELQRDYSRADKFHLSVSERFWIDAVPLRHINILRFSDSDAAPCIEDISPAHAVPLLRDNTYRFQYISGLGLTRSHFLDCVKLARNTQLHYLDRPRNHADMAGCQQLIEEQMK
jgi:hypothetical protein